MHIESYRNEAYSSGPALVFGSALPQHCGCACHIGGGAESWIEFATEFDFLWPEIDRKHSCPLCHWGLPCLSAWQPSGGIAHHLRNRGDQWSLDERLANCTWQIVKIKKACLIRTCRGKLTILAHLFLCHFRLLSWHHFRSCARSASWGSDAREGNVSWASCPRTES